MEDREFRRWLRRVEEEISLAAYHGWQAAREIAAITAGEADTMHLRRALAHIASARWHQAQVTRPAERALQRGGLQRRLPTLEPQMQLPIGPD